ncbi:MAG: ester cyclase [Candidatus Nanopelagicales bacterium]
MSDYKALAQQVYDGMNAGQDIDAWIDRFVAEDFVEHEAMPGMPTGREAPREMFAVFAAALPDYSVTVHELLQDGDKVVARMTFSGTHRGDFMGVPASGNRVEFAAIDIMQFRDDKIVAHWGVTDVAGLMAQMGAGPPQ